MKGRYLYVLMFSVPALLASALISILVAGATAGALWLFVFGDNSWPSAAGTALMSVALMICVASWIAFMSVAYVVGRKQEARGTLSIKHAAVAAGATVLLALLVVSHQWSVGNIGAGSDSILCSDFCKSKGFDGSGMPPRDTGEATCSCYDALGREAIKVPMKDVVGSSRR